MSYSIQAHKRDTSTKMSALRTSDSDAQIPAVVYGKKVPSTPLSINYSQFLKLFRKAGTSNIITLDVDGEKHEVIVHEVQLDPVHSTFLHIDFQAIVAGEKIHATIPVRLVGESPAAKAGLLVEHQLHELSVHCLPKDLVDHIDVDISVLVEDGDVIHINEIGIDQAKLEHTLDPSSPVASSHKLRVHKADEEGVADVSWEEGEVPEDATSGEESSSEETTSE